METICYALPLAPQDLVGIYKEKDESEKEYILYVDYDKTTEKLTDQHILIYLANTNFKTSFDKVTPSLVQEFIKTNFIVHCPMLSRVVAMILKVYLKWDLTDGEKLLTQNLFTMEQIDEFIKLNMNLIEDLIEVIQGLFPYTLWKLHSHMDDPSIEPNLVQIVEEIEVVDHPLNIGSKYRSWLQIVLMFCIWYSMYEEFPRLSINKFIMIVLNIMEAICFIL